MPKDMVQIRRGQRAKYEGPDAKIGRSQFNRSHGLKMTFDASYLYPFFLDEILPGDTMTMKLNGFARIFSPLAAPVMDNIELETFFFFVPTRLIWSNWAFFNGEHDALGIQDTSYTIPVMATGLTVDHDAVLTGHGLASYLGLPHGLATATVTGVSALPFRCYNLIHNEWFSDQNVSGAHVLTENKDNGPDGVGDYIVAKSNKKHDYFTSALPYLQKGTAQTVALSGTALVHTPASAGTDVSVEANDGTIHQKLDAGGTFVDVSATAGTEATMALYVDLSEKYSLGAAATLDINALRQSVAIQRLLETDARGGTRYVEKIKSHFGVTNPDFRLQRPEYLGGGKSFINVAPVAATTGIKAASSPDGLDSNIGALRGVGTGVIAGHSWAKSFTEHGYILGIIRARGDITYFQGMDRLWSRSTHYDFYIPALANLGEQSILNKELWIENDATDDTVFGYQERWAEYRMKHSRLVGHFNPDISGSLQFWHLAEDFSTQPALNGTFMQDQTPMARITTVDSEPDFLLDLWFDYRCARPLPVYSVPSLTNRF